MINQINKQKQVPLRNLWKDSTCRTPKFFQNLHIGFEHFQTRILIISVTKRNNKISFIDFNFSLVYEINLILLLNV